jgi:phosphoglycolate phosphatase
MRPAGPIDAVAFDLDGTLIDSAPDIAAALDAALTGSGLRHFDLATVRRWIGDGPDVLIRRALAAQGQDRPGVELQQRLRRDFDAHTLAAPLEHGGLFPGIAQLLASLHGCLPMVVVTNKPGALARAVLDAAGLLRFTTAVLGADTPKQRKPAPDMLLDAARRLAVPPGRLLMVGDSALDLRAARAAGCPAALVAWGYGDDTVPPGMNPWLVAEPQHLLHGLSSGRQPMHAH